MVKYINAKSYEANDTDRLVKVSCPAAVSFTLPEKGNRMITVRKTDASTNAITIIPKKGQQLFDTTLQVETATVIGAVTKSGNATIVVTASGMQGSPITKSVAVLNGDAIATTALKIRNALNTDTRISDMFTVSGTGATIVLTQISPTGNDSTLNISIDNGTCEGLTTAGTSTNTTVGVAVTINYANDYKTFISDIDGWYIIDQYVQTGQVLISPIISSPAVLDMLMGYTVVAGETLAVGDLVYPSGWDATTGKIKVAKADADGANPLKAAWMVASSIIIANAIGVVASEYELTGQNTDAATVGDPVYLSATAGGWTLTAPSGAGKTVQHVGVVTGKSATVGKVFLMPFFSKTLTATS